MLIRKSGPQPAVMRTPMGGTVCLSRSCVSWLAICGACRACRVQGSSRHGAGELTEDGDEDDEDCADHGCGICLLGRQRTKKRSQVCFALWIERRDARKRWVVVMDYNSLSKVPAVREQGWREMEEARTGQCRASFPSGLWRYLSSIPMTHI